MQYGNLKFKIIFLVIFLFAVLLLPKISWAAEYYVTPDGADSKTGTDWANAFAASSIPWTNFESGSADNTLYFDGGSSGVSYGAIEIRHDSNNRLYIRPGSYSPFPSGHAGLVTITTSSSAYNTCVKMGRDASPSGIGRNVTIGGESTAGSGTRNMTIGPCGGEGVYLRTNSANGNKFLYLEIKETGTCYDDTPTCSSGLGLQCHAITADGNNDNIEVGYCYIHDTWVKGIKLNGATSQYGAINIHHNSILTTSDDAIVCPQNCDIDNNIIDGANAPSYAGHPDALQADTRYVENIRIRNNEIRHYTQLLFFEADCNSNPDCSISNVLIANNVFEDRLHSPTLTFPGINLKTKGGGTNPGTWNNIIIANNTFVGLQLQPIQMDHTNTTTGTTTISNSKIVNNIMIGTGSNIMVWDTGYSFFSVTDSGLQLDYNQFNNGSAFQYWYNNGGAARAYTSFSDSNWLTDHPTFTHGSNAAPSFVNQSTYNYHLTVSNPGLNLSSYFTTDKDGITRSEFSRGAYEYVEAAPPPDTTPPSAPTGVTII